ncbi:UDP-glucose 4-epimerase family protein [Marinobacter sp. ANT_B65]|uniref:UDP-glucose 4-epimerase family protein n=1 Tax=Marinobacter sp. ANT_B65 TaxID=2039467 RepID=UPI000BBE0ED4|nr:SDR family oxidoreductase [Marinobacter sp. ANT_B65]PCM45241.1 nucleoside-diphosphate sugar epimerase [Marinobacter sp. ANT_B65]
MNILVTGATGFVGRRVCARLQKSQSYNLSSAVRQSGSNPPGSEVVIHEVDGQTSWQCALKNQQVVIHTAARAHIMNDEVADPLAEYRRVNVDGTLNLARQAAEAGVRRLIYISSVKVNGEQTPAGCPFTAEDAAAPADPYGVSKLESEMQLRQLAKDTGMEVVIIRPSLVYGPGAKGNFATMVRLVAKGLPLPLGSIRNRRSLLALDNLVDLIVTCISHPNAANQTFLAADGEDLSTTELLRGVANAMGIPSRLIPVPAGLLQFGATLLGQKALARRLLGSLQVDIEHTRKCLNWTPPLTVEQGLRHCFEIRQD